MQKQELLSALTNTWQNFALTLLLGQFMPESEWQNLAAGTIRFDGPDGPWLHIGTEWCANVLGDQGNRSQAIGEMEKMAKRALVREGHEWLLSYCEETNQVDLYKAVPWFQFARIIRNTVSHKRGEIVKEWPTDLTKRGITHVSWRNRTLDTRMVNQSISFTHQEALQLFADQFTFATNQLV